MHSPAQKLLVISLPPFNWAHTTLTGRWLSARERY